MATRKKSAGMTPGKTFDDGLAIRRDMFGPDGAEKQIAAATEFTAPMQDLVTRYCFGEVWQRPGLDRKQRSMLTLAILAALGRTPELKVHVRGAIANGVSVEEIREIMLHTMIYAGIPAGVSGTWAAADTLKELGIDI